jgi:hypothetical protein
MVLENRSFSISQGCGDPSPFLTVKDNASELAVHGVAFVEAQRVLCDHFEFAPKTGEGLPGYAVSVTGGVDVRSGFVDLRMDGEGREVNGLVAFDYASVLVDEDQAEIRKQG